MADAETPDSPTARDYRETVFLPETPFPMRGGLPQKEPAILEQWGDLYATLRAARQAQGAPLYVLHDGPPYANGDIHIGHALNKTLKDFVVRSQFLLGNDVDYVPGWDCHGLPIEWKIEEQYRAKGRRKDEVSKEEFRKACRDYAAGWIDVQAAQFKRLGITGDFDNRYATMDFTTEAKIVAEFHKFKNSGQLYRGSKPVMWSPVERTALADAEIEYHDHVSPTIWVKFPVVAASDDHDDDLLAFRHSTPSIVIWTTTPWTIPANRAISYGPEIAYGLYEVQSMEQGLEFQPWAAPGDRLIVADKLAEDVFKAAKIATWTRVSDLNPSGLECAHPLAALDPGYGFSVPLLAGDHVTDDAGTGFVHTAPGHGADDFEVWKAHGHHEVPRHGRSRRRLLSGRASVRRAQGARDRGQEDRQIRPRQRRGDGQADRGRNLVGARSAGAFLSAQLAVEGSHHLPQHAAVVHPHGCAAGVRRHPAGGPRSRPSTTPPSTPRRAATASARWSRAAPTG